RARPELPAVDLGASKAACLIGVVDPARPDAPPRIIGAAARPTPAGSSGLALAVVEASIRAAVAAAEERAGVLARSAVVAVSGRKLRARRLVVEVDLNGRTTTSEDVAAAKEAGAEEAAPDGFEILHALDIAAAVDGDAGWGDPRGLAGDRLDLDMIGVSARESALRHMETAVEAAHLDVSAFVAGPYAAARAVTLEDERDLGCLVLDMGAGETSFAAFDRGRLIAVGAAPIGGEHATRDIARVFGVARDDAERLKVTRGSALADGSEIETLRARALGDEAQIEIDASGLRAVIASRVEETFVQVLSACEDAGLSRRAVRHVVLTGGASGLAGVREAAERVLERQTRLGRPLNVDGAPASASGPPFAAVFGALDAALAEDRDATAAPAAFAFPAPGWAQRLFSRF
ncbi:MAG: cell division protein FtsA, partial [Pseudomonadota bacterium]